MVLCGAAALLAAGTVVLVPTTAGALEITVSTTTDGGPGSLRQAVTDINLAGAGPHTINLAAGQTYVLDQCAEGDNGTLTIQNGPLVINGNGATIQQTCDDARVLRYNSTEDLLLDTVTVTGGDRIGRGGGLKTFGDVTILDSTFIGNSATGEGGGLWSDDRAVTAIGSTFAENDAGTDGGAIYSLNGLVTVLESTFTGNVAADDGGAIVAVEQDLDFVTMVGNSAGQDGGAVVAEVVRLFGTVMADNPGDDGGESCAASMQSEGYSWTDDASCDPGGSTDVLVVDGDPVLGALADNGGPTQTMLPGAGSPLIQAIPGDVEGCGGNDQRGVSRPQDGACEIGSVELAAEPPASTTTTTAAVTTSTTAGETTSTTAAATTSTTVPAAAAQAVTATPRYTG